MQLIDKLFYICNTLDTNIKFILVSNKIFNLNSNTNSYYIKNIYQIRVLKKEEDKYKQIANIDKLSYSTLILVLSDLSKNINNINKYRKENNK